MGLLQPTLPQHHCRRQLVALGFLETIQWVLVRPDLPGHGAPVSGVGIGELGKGSGKLFGMYLNQPPEEMGYVQHPVTVVILMEAVGSAAYVLPPCFRQPQQLLVGHSVNFRIGDSGLSVLFRGKLSCQIGLSSRIQDQRTAADHLKEPSKRWRSLPRFLELRLCAVNNLTV